MNQNANDQLLLLRENTERRVSTLCRAPLRVAFCEAFFIHSRMLDSCWVFVVQSCTPPKQPWKDGRVPELYEPGLRLSLGAGTMHRNFSGQDVWNLVSQVSWAAWGVTGVTSWPRMGFVGAARIGGTPYVDDFVITGISRAAAVVSLEARSTKSW